LFSCVNLVATNDTSSDGKSSLSDRSVDEVCPQHGNYPDDEQ
jgi:hypothetical protein